MLGHRPDLTKFPVEIGRDRWSDHPICTNVLLCGRGLCIHASQTIGPNPRTIGSVPMPQTVQNVLGPRSRSRFWLTTILVASSGAASASADQKAARPTRLPSVTSTPQSAQDPSPTQSVSTPAQSVSTPAAYRQPTVGQPVSVRTPSADLGVRPNKDSDVPTRWLRSTTSHSSNEVAERLIEQASVEFRSRAWLSAETTAWEAIRHAAESIDAASGTALDAGSGLDAGAGLAAGSALDAGSAVQSLAAAKSAIEEARDFSGLYGAVDSEAIARMARSHQTSLIDPAMARSLTGTEASDLYLDFARRQLAPIARSSVTAARGMDLIAAIALGRADAKTLPSGTALALRRAALQGQPGNASLASRLGLHLADLGLDAEARWALEHSMSIQFDPATAGALAGVMRRSGDAAAAEQMIASAQRHRGQAPAGSAIRVPEIMELTPAEFAMVSKPTMPLRTGASPTNATRVDSSPNSPTTTRTTPAQTVAFRTGEVVDIASPSDTTAAETFNGNENGDGEAKKVGPLRKFWGAMPWSR